MLSLGLTLGLSVGLTLAGMSYSDRKRKREVVALVDMLLTNTSAELDGDGHKIMAVQSYLDATPWLYHDEILSLEQLCYGADSHIDGISIPRGVPSISMHKWLAEKIEKIDPRFTYRRKIGRGSQAREMLKVCKAFAKEHKHTLVKTPWERARDTLTTRAIGMYWFGMTGHLMAPGGSVEARDLNEFKHEWISPDQASA